MTYTIFVVIHEIRDFKNAMIKTTTVALMAYGALNPALALGLWCATGHKHIKRN